MSEDLIARTLEAIRTQTPEAILRPFAFRSESLNELLFFLKPECLFESTDTLIAKRLETTLATFDGFDVGLEVAVGSPINIYGSVGRTMLLPPLFLI